MESLLVDWECVCMTFARKCDSFTVANDHALVGVAIHASMAL